MGATTQAIENTEDMLDVRDIIARYEFLETQGHTEDDDGTDEHLEFALLRELLGELKSNGEDEQWRGDWYPITLIRDSYFEEYAQELAEDIGAISHNVQWPLMHIDWKAASEALQMDYTEMDFNGVVYWYR